MNKYQGLPYFIVLKKRTAELVLNLNTEYSKLWARCEQVVSKFWVILWANCEQVVSKLLGSFEQGACFELVVSKLLGSGD